VPLAPAPKAPTPAALLLLLLSLLLLLLTQAASRTCSERSCSSIYSRRSSSVSWPHEVHVSVWAALECVLLSWAHQALEGW
jgi:hypothetical protein